MSFGNHLGLFCVLASAVFSVALTPLIIKLAGIWGLVDLPHARKVHRHPVPRIGGLAIAISALLPLGVVIAARGNIFQPGGQSGVIVTLLAAAFSVMAVGLLDDLINIPAKYKLLVLLLASGALCEAGGVIGSISFEGHTYLSLGVAAWPVTILWIVGVTVSVNFIDGLDGLAAGIVAMACAVVAVGCFVGGAAADAILALSLLGALLGFLVFNFNPAKVFMGDSGSMFIGFLLAGICVTAHPLIGSAHAILIPVLALSVPIFDTFFTFVRRGVLQRRSLFSAERGHIHHRLLDGGLCHRHAVLLLYAVTFAGSCVAMVSMMQSAPATAITAACFCGGLLVLFRAAGTAGARATVEAVRRNRAIGREAKRHRRVFEELQLAFRDVVTFDSWWRHVCLAADQLGFAKIDLPLIRRDGSTNVLKWRRDDSMLAEADSLTAEVPIPQRRIGQSLRVSAEVTVDQYLESAGQRLAMFSRLIAECSPRQLPETPTANPNQAAAASGEQMPNPQHAEIGPNSLTSIGSEFSGLRVAVVHDFLYTYAGAERVLEQLVAMFPECELFSIFDFLPDSKRGFIRNKKVNTTFIQNMPLAQRYHRAYLPLFPLAIEQLDLSGYDIVISSSYMAAKGVLTRPDQMHLCYCHTPVRYAWDLQGQYLSQVSGVSRLLKSLCARVLLHYIRNWDVQSSNRVDRFVTNSHFVGQRIEKIYRRESETIYPPVDTDWYFLKERKEDFYVTASRLVPYKRVDMIVEAFSRMPDRRLIVIGEGPEMDKIRSKAGENVRLMGYQPAARLRHYLQQARAFVFAAEEDFGIVPVEAQCCGTPVICYGKGGVTESVIDGKTGVHFHEQTADALVAAVLRFEDLVWDPTEIRRNAERFSIRQFRQRFAATAKMSWLEFKNRRVSREAPPDKPRVEVALFPLPKMLLKDKPLGTPLGRAGDSAVAIEPK